MRQTTVSFLRKVSFTAFVTRYLSIHESWGVRHLFFDFDPDNEVVDDVEYLTTEPLYETMIPTRPGSKCDCYGVNRGI